MHNFKRELYLKIIFIISCTALVSAFFIEYALGYQPCNLCLIERIPYGISIILVITIFILKKNENFLIMLLILTFIFSLAISIYHFGIEQGFFQESSVCGTKDFNENITKEDLLELLSQERVSCKDVTFRIFGLSLTSINIVISLLLILTLTKIFTNYEKKDNKVEEFIRVDHAGERGAVKIYEGQLLALNTLVKDESLRKTIEEMKIHEKEHCEFFENEIKKRKIRPTKFLPLWDLLGVGLGFGSTILGKKAAMLCTASVEEVIDEHYQNQINHLGPEEKNLKNKIIKFREDELHHKDIAYEKGATKKGLYSLMDKIIKTGSKIAINISEKI